MGESALVTTMATTSEEKFAKFFWRLHLLRCIRLEALSLFYCVELVFVLLTHHARLLELLLPHSKGLLSKLLLLHTIRTLFELILLNIFLLEIPRFLELLVTALPVSSLLVSHLSLVRVSISIATVAIIIASTW